MELLSPLILVVYAKYTTEKAFDLMASHGIKVSYTMPSRNLCKNTLECVINPRTMPSGLSNIPSCILHRFLEGMV